MITINTDTKIEKDFKKIVTLKYGGDITKALTNFIKYERMRDLNWEERFQYQLDELRRNIKGIGVINDNQIDQAIKKYRTKKRG